MHNLKNSTRLFLTEESGAVTVDWVVLTAGLVGLGLATMAVVSGGVEDLSGDMQSQLETQTISASFGSAAVAWEAGQWDMSNPGIYDSYVAWMANFEDQQLLDHMNNMAQYADAPAGSGHPIDTYHDEFYIAQDEAISRGLIDPPT
ncbi:hypothetical protein [Nioella aestuarii]|uniref:hypothetical protein n=1 Tax=Nioella aestuarii TaxID=1662864 RepID=UPI003D7FA7B1